MKITKEIGYELLRVVDMDGFMELWNRTDTETKDKIVNGIGELAVKLVNGVEKSESTCNLQSVNASTLKICSGCGRIEGEPMGVNTNGELYLGCCPDNNYIPIKEYWKNSKYLR